MFFKSLKNRLRKKLIDYLTCDLFKIVRAEDLYQERPDGLYLAGKLIDPLAETEMRNEAIKLLDSPLFVEILQKPIEYDACRKMFEEGKSDEWDLWLGRMELHVVRTQKELLKAFALGKRELPKEE